MLTWAIGGASPSGRATTSLGRHLRTLEGKIMTETDETRHPRGRTRVHTYYPEAKEHDSKVATLLLPSNASAQVSALMEEDGFLIRVWPPNGTHEFGGSNSTVATIVVRF